MQRLLSPKQVAQAIGVSESSLKRWCDKGLLSTVRTAGGHRRVTAEEVVTFLRQTGRSMVQPEVLGLPPANRQVAGHLPRMLPTFLKALCAGDEACCRRVVFDAYLARHSVAEIGDELIAPAFEQVGACWSSGSVEVYEERRAVEVCLRLFHELRTALPALPAGAPLAIGATPAGDAYTLANLLVELTLRELGWNAECFGVDIPLASLQTAVAELKPRLVWISVSTLADVDAFVADFTSFYRGATAVGTVVLVGGRALTPELRGRLQYTCHCDQLRHLVSFADGLWRRPAPKTADA